MSAFSFLSIGVVSTSLALVGMSLGKDPSSAEDLWAFQPPKRSDLPTVSLQDELFHRMDAFIVAALGEQELSARTLADDGSYFRRLHMVITGLPSSIDDQQAFAADDEPNKRQRWVDRLLASYGFGERMTSFWLPIARYAEDQAHEVGDNKSLTYPNAYLYRQWVIDAFNRDLPYKDFIRYQLAADLDEDALAERDALGFLGLGPKYYNRGRLEVKADEWEDRVDTVTRSFLGLTVACARCHDHKYDPISAEDYHALAGVFASTEMLNEALPGDAGEKKERKDKSPRHTRHVVKEGKIQDLPVYLRGDVTKTGETVKRRFLPALSGGEALPFDQGSGRGQLAEAIASPNNPLTARVMVNRLWKEVFGSALVQTPSNFGTLGQAPTHPALLDELAIDFRDHGSVKRLVREMLESAAFQRTSVAGPTLAERDPSNLWLGRSARRRMSFEMWRDAVLQASGDLDPSGGRSLEIEDDENLRRTVYARISRLDLNDVLEQFDYPDPNIHAAARVETTTTTQKLYLLNHPFVLERASRLAARASAVDENETEQITWLYRQLFARQPSDAELERGRSFLDQGEDRLAALAHVLICSNEMLYLD
ncbi:MAG: hypothetical protein ACI8T1_002511 [Verrucomicrobiales bacterium]|jgi:hypothetical protein